MVALVFCGDLKYCPYITRYIERLEQNNVKYKVEAFTGMEIEKINIYVEGVRVID